MESFGRHLRAEREAREVSIEELSRVTKISRQILHGIEGDRFEELPPPVFLRGFVRSICRTLGLPEEEYVRRFDDYIATHGPGVTVPGEAAPRQPGTQPQTGGQQESGASPAGETPAPRSSFGVLPFVIGIVVLIAAIVFAYNMGGEPEPVSTPSAKEAPSASEVAPEGESATDAGTTDVATAETGATEETPEAAVSPAAEQPPQTPPAPSPAPVTKAEKPAVARSDVDGKWIVLQAKGECWVEITKDADGTKDYTLRAGERFSQRYTDTMVLKVGNPLELSLEAEGIRYERVGTVPRPISIEFPLTVRTRQQLLAASRAEIPATETKPSPAGAAPAPGSAGEGRSDE